MSFYGFKREWPRYISVAEKQEKILSLVWSLRKKGQRINPIFIENGIICRTPWAKTWCKHLEGCGFETQRLSRGRSYLRHGSVLNLEIHSGIITALVSGSSLYKVNIKIGPLLANQWHAFLQNCTESTETVIETVTREIFPYFIKNHYRRTDQPSAPFGRDDHPL